MAFEEQLPLKARAIPANGSMDFVAGISPAILAVESVIAEIARTSIPILLVGESGTGKLMFARRIHALSQQCDRALTKIACATTSPETFAEELGLNGKEEGNTDTPGSIFFDEVGELEPTCQRILLNALPDGEGSAHRRVLSARVISATTKNLDDETRAGRFRAELFYRINGVCLRLPPLRERKEDIPLLAESLIKKHAAQLGRPAHSLSPRMLEVFSTYSWPGNVRQLENIVKNIVALGHEEFAISELVANPPEKRATIANGRSDSLRAASRAASREAEREMILKALDRTRWNRKRAAQELQISYKSLLYKLKQIGAEEPEVRTA